AQEVSLVFTRRLYIGCPDRSSFGESRSILAVKNQEIMANVIFTLHCLTDCPISRRLWLYHGLGL
ncbi:hypothetical protein S245_001339, partial [Arachis hypogaea]